MRTIYWASKQLKKGEMVRRKSWIEGSYLFLDKNRDLKHCFEDFIGERDLCINDIEAIDWCIIDKQNEGRRDLKEKN